MKTIIDRILSVKSIVTLVLTFVFSYLSVTEKISGEQFMTIFTVVVSFYFGTQSEKKAALKSKDNSIEIIDQKDDAA